MEVDRSSVGRTWIGMVGNSFLMNPTTPVFFPTTTGQPANNDSNATRLKVSYREGNTVKYDWVKNSCIVAWETLSFISMFKFRFLISVFNTSSEVVLFSSGTEGPMINAFVKRFFGNNHIR